MNGEHARGNRPLFGLLLSRFGDIRSRGEPSWITRSFGVGRMCGLGALLVGTAGLISGCQGSGNVADVLGAPTEQQYTYVIGPGDQLNLFVWRNPELSKGVTVRPDGKISAPLVEELVAAGKTPEVLAREIETALATYVREPLVTVSVSEFQGTYGTQIRVVGQAAQPASIPYRDGMTLLDVMISVGGLTEFAAGNRAQLVRVVGGETRTATVRLQDLVKDGDISANTPVAPGDVLIIPESWF